MSDALLEYCIALDANNFDGMCAILEEMMATGKADSFYDALQGLQHRFDSYESYTKQLLDYRRQLQTERRIPHDTDR